MISAEYHQTEMRRLQKLLKGSEKNSPKHTALCNEYADHYRAMIKCEQAGHISRQIKQINFFTKLLKAIKE